jgi:hypothetical protein
LADVSLRTRRVVPLTVILTAPLIAALAAARAEAAERQSAAVVIRVYELGTRSPELTEALAGSVTELLERANAGIDVRFVDCARPGACSEVARDTLVLRLAQGVHATAPRQCGEAAKGAARQRGVLMTIFRGCVLETQRELRAGAITQQGIGFALLTLTEADILAALVVHELIHLVLPDEVHGKGLFKATLDARDWVDIAGGWPRLDTALVSRLGRALAVPRATPAMPVMPVLPVTSVTQSVIAERRIDVTPSVP